MRANQSGTSGRREFLAAMAGVAAATPLRAAGDEPLLLITYDHGGLVLWGIDHFARYLREAVEWLERYPGFKIGLDNETYTYEFLAERSPELLEELRGYLKRFPGRFGVGTCTYGQPLSAFINEESNIRQLEYALEADRRILNATPAIYAMSEHAMHSQIPQLLRGFGFQGALMRTHFMMYGYNPTFDEPVGWWVGLDGSRIPTVPTYKGEGAEFGKTTEDNWILTRYPGPQCHESLEEFRAKFARIQPLVASRVDDSGLKREDLVKQYEGKPGYRWILLEELFENLPAPKAEFRTAPNDFVVRMPWGYCGNEIWNRCREAEVAVLTAERLATLAAMLGGEGRESGLDRAWKNLLVAQHHDIQITGIVAEARRYLGASLETSREIGDRSLRHVAAQMAGGDTAQITVFNPHSWRREEWVEADVPLPPGTRGPLSVEQNGRPSPAFVLSAQPRVDGSLESARLAVMASVPGLGFQSYAVHTASAPASAASPLEIDHERLTIRSPFWNLRLDPRGGIAEWTNPKGARPVLAPGVRGAFFAGRIEGQDCESSGTWRLFPGPHGAPWVKAREEGKIGGIPYLFELAVQAGSPRVDCHVAFQFDGQRIGLVSDQRRDAHSGFVHECKLRFKMLPGLSGSVFGVRDVPFGLGVTQDPYVQGIYWTALTDGRRGVALFNRGAMGSVREQDGGFSLPLAFSMYYIWRTVMLRGTFTHDFALLPFEGPWQAVDLHRKALEFNFPLAAAGSAPGTARLGWETRPLAVDAPGALVSAVFRRQGAAHVRLYEPQGRRASALLTAASGGFTEVDLAGRIQEPVPGSLSFDPWQIRTFRLESAAG